MSTTEAPKEIVPETEMMNYKPFVIYKNISRYMVQRGYTCDSQNDLINAVNAEDENAFETALYGERECIINNFRCTTSNRRSVSIPGLTSYERMCGKWKRPVNAKTATRKEIINSKMFVYFHTPVIGPTGSVKKVAKVDAVTAMKYLVLTGLKSLLFVHGADIISAATKQFLDPMLAPSKNNFNFEIESATLFDIKVGDHIYVPRHEIIKNSKEFLKNENLESDKLPKISITDPAIRHLGAKVGDIIKIYRNMDFSDVSTLFFREVVSTPLEIHKNKKDIKLKVLS